VPDLLSFVPEILTATPTVQKFGPLSFRGSGLKSAQFPFPSVELIPKDRFKLSCRACYTAVPALVGGSGKDTNALIDGILDGRLDLGDVGLKAKRHGDDVNPSVGCSKPSIFVLYSVGKLAALAQALITLGSASSPEQPEQPEQSLSSP
jgi:hypothetical protein